MEPDFSIYNNFNTAVLIPDESGRIIFRNYRFNKLFGDIKNLDKFSNYFSFDICTLYSEDILKSNPISFALVSEESYTAHAVYQKNKVLHFLLTSFTDRGYRVLAFKDITDSILYESLEKEYEKLSLKCEILEEQNKVFSSSKVKAENQAIKMALMHRVSNVIRESVDPSKIINSALKELSNLFGAVKVYYAESKEDYFVIKHVYPNKFKNVVDEKIELEAEAKKDIAAKNIRINPCIKEYLNSKITFASSVSRMIVPVYRLNEILGILLIYTPKPSTAQNDILQAISTQLATAVVQASLFQEISLKNKELQKTLTELKETQIQLINSEKMASLGQLVAGVAHEINTPLASINSNNDILSTLIRRIENCDEKIFKTIENINQIDKEAIKRINRIVQSLKKFVRLDESELQESDINREIDLTLELIKHETKNRISIEKNYGKIPTIRCYPNMLNQVFMNVLINACHSIKKEGTITITTGFSDGALKVKIKDTGEGIDDSIKDKIFNAGTTTKKIGTGLGLAITKKIIEKHKGTISFVSEKNKGTEFTIIIPEA